MSPDQQQAATAHASATDIEQHDPFFKLPTGSDDPRLTAPLPMIHGKDIILTHLTQDHDTFFAFYHGRGIPVTPEQDPSLDAYTGHIHPDHSIYKYGGPVFRVQHPTLGLEDVMFCDTDICTVCNDKLDPGFIIPGPGQSPTGGRPFVHTLRDCREAEEDGTLTFWQTQKHAMFKEEYAPEMRVGKVRFTCVGMLGTREATMCVPESCKACKGLIGKERLESADGSLVVWKEKKAKKKTVRFEDDLENPYNPVYAC